MKKTFWGYNVKEVDEKIESLEMQVYKLTQKSKKLENERTEFDGQMQKINDELRAAIENSETADERVSASNAAAAEAEAKVAELKALLDKANEEKDVEEAPTVAPVASAESKNDLDAVTEICRSAYADMISVKSLTREKMEALLVKYAEGWKKSNEMLKDLLAGIIESRDRAKESFIASADEILQKFDGIEDALAVVNENIDEYESNCGQFEDELNNIISELGDNRDNAEETVEEVIVETVDEDADLPAIYREIKARNKTVDEIKVDPEATAESIIESVAENAEKTTDNNSIFDMIDVSMIVDPKDLLG